LIIWLHFARALEQRVSIYEAVTRAHIIFILAATVITIQLTSAPFVLTMALIVLLRTWFGERMEFGDRPPLLIKLIVLFRLSWLSLLILVIWMGRGYFLSGYPLYPLTQGGFAVDWAVPRYSARAEAESLAALAKYGDDPTLTVNQKARGWVGAWLQRQVEGSGLVALLYPAALAFLLFLLAGRLRWALRNHQPQRLAAAEMTTSPPAYLLLLLPIFLAVLIWWLTTPEPKLAYALFWLLPIIGAHKVLVTLGMGTSNMLIGRPRLNSAVAFVLVNFLMLFSLALAWPQAVTLEPGFSPLPTVNVVEQGLSRRFHVRVPVQDERCWDAQLPCSPYLNAQLRQRGNEMRHGFQIMPQFEEMIAGLQR
jgi:hypothetical protein